MIWKKESCRVVASFSSLSSLYLAARERDARLAAGAAAAGAAAPRFLLAVAGLAAAGLAAAGLAAAGFFAAGLVAFCGVCVWMQCMSE